MFTFHLRKEVAGSPSDVTIVAETIDGKTKFAAARCSRKDNFSRKKGRMIAGNRLNAGKVVHTIPSIITTEIFVNVAKKLATEISVHMDKTKWVLE